MKLPQPKFKDICIAGTICFLMLMWSLSVLQSISSLVVGQGPTSLLMAAVSTIGYLVTVQFLLERSQFATYLWLRFVSRRDLSFLTDKV